MERWGDSSDDGDGAHDGQARQVRKLHARARGGSPKVWMLEPTRAQDPASSLDYSHAARFAETVPVASLDPKIGEMYPSGPLDGPRRRFASPCGTLGA